MTGKKRKTRKLILLFEILIVLSILTATIGCLSPYDIHFKRATIALSKSNYDEAISEYTKLIEIAPDKPTAYFWRGVCYFDVEQYDLAIDDFTRAIELKDKRLDVDYNKRGLSYSAIGDYESAISDFTKAINIYSNPLYYDNRGLAYHERKNYELAIKDFTIAIQRMPRDARPYSNRADSYIAIGEKSLAVADLRTVINLDFDPVLTQSSRERLKLLE